MRSSLLPCLCWAEELTGRDIAVKSVSKWAEKKIDLSMESKYRNSPWVIPEKRNPKTRLRLFCFLYAGGGASIFRQWSENMPEGVEVCAVQLPGRENRIAEPPFRILASLVEAMVEALAPYFDVPFAFFGHSLGAKIAFELVRELRRKKGIQPVHLFVSGARLGCPKRYETFPSFWL